MKYLFTTFVFLCVAQFSFSQELLSTISINTEQLQIDQQRGGGQIYPEIQRVMQDFINGRRWTNDTYSQEEKIKLNINLILTKATSQGDFEANARIQVLRPVYGTNYETVILSLVDKSFNFKYQTGTPITYNDNSYIDNLGSLLAYYSNLALIYSYDSFGKLAGDPFVQKLYNLTNLAQNAAGGWGTANDIRSKVGIAEALINQQLTGIREANYQYHRVLLDSFKDKPDETRDGLVEMLMNLRQINQIRPGSATIRLFFESKGDEIFQIMDESSATLRQQTFAYMSLLDPAKTEMYRKLIR
ncbi:MAG: hypothetical protein RJA76_470 [Bacteroidota bacterium]|jgi:hypothetical protein